jgi:hypothetical protein
MNDDIILIPSLLATTALFVMYYAYLYYRVAIMKDYHVQFVKNSRSMKLWVRRHIKRQDAASVQQAVQVHRLF